MNTQSSQPLPTVRTVAQARAERQARAAARVRRPVTDESADALLPAYDRADEFPALTSRNLERREQRDDLRRAEFSHNTGARSTDPVDASNANDPNFNRAAPHASVTNAAVDTRAAADLEQLLRALCLSPSERTVVEGCLEGRGLTEIAGALSTNKQKVQRVRDAIAVKMARYQNEDPSDGWASVYRRETNRVLHHALAGGRPAAEASACACGSHQHRAQRVKGREGVFTFHCTHCKKKRTQAEFNALVGLAGAARVSEVA